MAFEGQSNRFERESNLESDYTTLHYTTLHRAIEDDTLTSLDSASRQHCRERVHSVRTHEPHTKALARLRAKAGPISVYFS
jgi:hypothetical protein